MAQYIDKSAIVAEIDRRIEVHHNLGHWNAKHEFLKVKKFIDTLEVKEVKEPTASDRGMAAEIIINLKRVEQDYCISLTKEIEWLRNKLSKEN